MIQDLFNHLKNNFSSDFYEALTRFHPASSEL